MKQYTREITKEIFDNAINGILNDNDYNKVFSNAEVCGYGVYYPLVYKKDGKYFVRFELGDTCD